MAAIEDEGWAVVEYPNKPHPWIAWWSLSRSRRGAIDGYMEFRAKWAASWRNMRRRGEVKAVRVRIIAEVPE